MDRGTAKTAARSRRFLVLGVGALALGAGGAFYLTRSAPPPGTASAQAIGALPAAAGAGSVADVALAGPPVLVTVPPSQAGQAGPPAASRRTRAASATPSAGTSAASPSATAGSAASATASGTGNTGGTSPAQVLATINQARASAGLPALTVTTGLDASSGAHNLKMADGCGLSHQCPGEAAIGDRETAAGVIWTAAGENIGEGGPVADTQAAITQMAVGLTQSMLTEQPPNDGHRMNILSTTFTHIGIAVYRDSSGTVWLTQDFSN
jgi:uncharacterized protein YkwD